MTLRRLPAHRARLAFAALIATFALLASALPATAADWSNLGGNAGRNALSPEIGPATATLAWSGGRSSLIAWHPVTEGNRVFMVRQPKWPYEQPDDAFIVARDLTTGQELWAKLLPYNAGDWIPWIAGVRDGRVYCSRSGNGASVSAKMYALDVVDGSTLWASQDLQDAGAYDGVVFASDGDLLVASFQDVWRIDAATGQTDWHSARLASVSGSCGGARHGNGLYILDAVYGGHVIKKYDVDTGLLLYQTPIMTGFLCQTTPFVAPDGTVLVSRGESSPSNDAYYAWTDTGTGFTLKWQVAGFAGAYSQQAVGPDGSVYAVLPGQRLARLNGATGSVVNWIALPAGFSMARMACDAAGRLYYSNGSVGGGRLYVYTADLQLLWDTVVSGINIGGPSIGQNGTLVVCNSGSDVRAYRVTDPSSVPTANDLRALACAPNPFRDGTTLGFALERSGPVRLAVYDVCGRLVRTLVDGREAPGLHAVAWEGRDAHGSLLPSGVYYYRLQTQDDVRSGHIVLAR